MLRNFQKTALLGLALFMIVCGTSTRSAAQQIAQPLSARFANDVALELARSESFDPRSFLLLMGTQIRETELDCSHFVQFLYEQAGLYYGYTPSRVLYEGIKDFKRVSHPKAGDLIVWQGHVGIVVNPEDATFLSALRSGVKTASYESDYWKKRGHPHFLRYVGSREKDTPAWSGRKTLASGALRASSGSE